MDRTRRILPLLVAILLLMLAINQPGRRGVLLALGIVFIAIGIRRSVGMKKRDRDPGAPDDK
jgi:hypothetical protein